LQPFGRDCNRNFAMKKATPFLDMALKVWLPSADGSWNWEQRLCLRTGCLFILPESPTSGTSHFRGRLQHSLNYVSWKQRKEMAGDLKEIYSASTVEQAEASLEAFGEKWDATHPKVSQSWRNNWQRIIPYFGYPPQIRRVIYTTNTIESLNMSLRKVIKNRGSFPNDEAMFKLLYLALTNISKKWTMPIKDWKSALNQFSIMFGERLPNF